MSQETCYGKTELGRAELRARRVPLNPKLRALLVMIDGKQTVNDYLEKLTGFGIDKEAFTELVTKGLIEVLGAPVADMGNTFAPLVDEIPQEVEVVQPNVAASERLGKIYDFYNSTIRDVIGLRGFMLQLDVEKATTLDDYRDLRERFLTAVTRASSDAVARSLKRELDRLLG